MTGFTGEGIFNQNKVQVEERVGLLREIDG